MLRFRVLLILLAPLTPLRAGSQFVQEPQLESCRLFNEALHALEEKKIDGRTARERFKALWPALKVDDVPPPKEGRWQWMFPLAGHDASCFGESYLAEDYRFLDGPVEKGSPYLRLYLRDRDRDGKDDRTKEPAPVVSATSGVVVASEKFWKEEDPCPWGDYVMVFDQNLKLFFLYGGLGRIRVGPGQLVEKGEVLGWLGRTGKDIAAKRLGTQLRFQVHSYDDGLFYPVYPGRALRVAGQVQWPIPEREVRPKLKPPKDLPPDATLSDPPPPVTK
jgi:murein DD-endopeptidase MepM/ murein hydrolase activator NlpD